MTSQIWTHFLSSTYFCQLGIFSFNNLTARNVIGSPKKPIPKNNVLIFMNIEEVVRSATATAGTRIPASLRRYASLGNGGVEDNALEMVSHTDECLKDLSYFANLSQPSAMSPTICITGLIFDHIASSIGCLVCCLSKSSIPSTNGSDLPYHATQHRLRLMTWRRLQPRRCQMDQVQIWKEDRSLFRLARVYRLHC